MGNEKGITNTVQADDIPEGIAQKFGISYWVIIYGHENNKQFRWDNPDYRKIRPGDMLFIPGTPAMALSNGGGVTNR